MPLFMPSHLITPVLCPYIVSLHRKSRVYRSLLSRGIAHFWGFSCGRVLGWLEGRPTRALDSAS